MQIPTVFAVVTSITHLEVRQAVDCASSISAIEAKMPPLPTALASLSSAAKTDACKITAATAFTSEIEDYQSRLDEWLLTKSNGEMVASINAQCTSYLESTASAEFERLKTCVPGGAGESSTTRGPRTSAATANKSGSASANPTNSAQTGSTASAAGAASSSAPAAAAGSRSAVSMVLAAGTILVGSLLVL